jgi:hypothetical protein
MPGMDWEEWLANPPANHPAAAPTPVTPPVAPKAPDFGRDGYDVLFPLPTPRPLPADAAPAPVAPRGWDARLGASQLG